MFQYYNNSTQAHVQAREVNSEAPIGARIPTCLIKALSGNRVSFNLTAANISKFGTKGTLAPLWEKLHNENLLCDRGILIWYYGQS